MASTAMLFAAGYANAWAQLGLRPTDTAIIAAAILGFGAIIAAKVMGDCSVLPSEETRYVYLPVCRGLHCTALHARLVVPI